MSTTLRPKILLPSSLAIALLVGVSGQAACAHQVEASSDFEEHPVKFHNQDVKLAGSLLLPKREAPAAAVIFVHGAGQQTRESYREVAEHFARQGIATWLVFD